jgi:putative membrane protein
VSRARLQGFGLSKMRPNFVSANTTIMPMAREQQENAMKTNSLPFFAAFAAFCLACPPASAPAADKNTSTAESVSVDPTDEKFMLAATQGGRLEVRLGEVAKERAARQGVQDFGAMMATDHAKEGEELKAVATKNDVTLPADLDAKHKAIVDGLSKLSGAEFDKAYIAEMVKHHEKDAIAFEDASKTAKNPDVKGFAAKTLPVIKSHLKKIKAIAAADKKMSTAGM